MTSKKKIILIDGMAIVYRAFYAFIHNPIINSKKINTSATYGFINTILDLQKRHKPSHFMVAFDTSAETERRKIYPEYKANRDAMPEDIQKAIPQIKSGLDALNIKRIELDGYEADDIIGTIAKKNNDEYECLLFTSDKDFAQLIEKNIFMLKPGSKKAVESKIGLSEFRQIWGVEEPKQVIDILALWGDTADNIPGVPGIGEKTAKKLIAKYESVEGIYENIADLKGKQRENLLANREQALFSKKLVTIDTDVPIKFEIEDFVLKEYDEQKLRNFCKENEFFSFYRKFFNEELSQTNEQKELFSEQKKEGNKDSAKNIKLLHKNYQLITTEKARRALARRLSMTKEFAFDTETDGLDPKQCNVLAISFSFEANDAYCVMIDKKSDLEDFSEIFADEKIAKIGHNLNFDVSVLEWNGVDVRGKLYDTFIAHCLVEPNARHKLDNIAQAFLEYENIRFDELFTADEIKQKNKVSLASLMPIAYKRNPTLFSNYACEDADVTGQIWQKLKAILAKKNLDKLFYEIESPLTNVIVEMQKAGINFDIDRINAINAELCAEVIELEKKIKALASDDNFNLNSPKQLGEILFDKLKVASNPKKTKTGQYKTDEFTLQSLRGKHEIIDAILQYRQDTKLRSTYTEALPKNVHPETKRIHSTFHQILTSTGRLSSDKPNLQNIPSRSARGREIRTAFIPTSDDYILLSADYSQIELRILAHISQEKTMIKDFEAGRDIHSATASNLYNIALEEILPEMRAVAKTVNFGVIYGISAFGLSTRIGISRGDAKKIIDDYFEKYPKIREYMDKIIKEARENGFVCTLAGRKREMTDINSRNHLARTGAERGAINAPIQGTAADMIKIAMVNVNNALLKNKLKSKMILQVHDELIFDVHKSELDDLSQIVSSEMKNAFKLSVPIEVNIGKGKNWLEAH